MKEIILIDGNNKVCGVWSGEWNKEVWSVINKEGEVGMEFEEWSEGEEEGDGWKIYESDGMGVLVVDEGKDWKKCKKEYWKMVLRKY
jgi:hypothetical protein